MTLVQERCTAATKLSKIVAARLSRAEPPLRKEVIEYMSDDDSHKWSMRRQQGKCLPFDVGVFRVSATVILHTWTLESLIAEAAHPDELDEEFDTFPTPKSPELLCA
ncbi:protein QUIRKY [Cinnamomum micranthum f. kanehirae]|uniref:Protein QUIRKY n=1 Tax=Cinnamomum micranthum f. kanehirae TaxID=337451 RepID=A0A443PM22_9MAGN|nr:protein QUIRKY [Cinnamomum micranthum f. kanehirae]